MSRKYKFELKRNAVEHYLNTNDSLQRFREMVGNTLSTNISIS